MPSQSVVLNEMKSRVEDELILLCARTRAEPQTVARIRTISNATGTVDWEHFYQLARRHSILPLVYSQLKTTAANVPPEPLARLKANYQDNVARNLFLTAELCSLLQKFADAGIEAVPYKGPALAVYAYGKVELRRFVDLDILVQKSDLLRAKDILTAQGFDSDTPWTEVQQSILLRTQHNLSLRRGRLVVELHWEIASSLFASLQPAGLWARLETMRLNNLEVKCLAAEDLVLALCVHGSKHFWERLAWICDVAEIIARKDLDWPRLLDQAVSSGSERMLFLGLHLANQLLDAPLPPQIESKLAGDTAVSALADVVVKRLFGPSGQVPMPMPQGVRFNWALRTGWRSKMHYCRLLLQPTDADVETIPLPRLLTFAYSLMRPFALLRRDRQRRSVVTNSRVNHEKS